MTNLTPIAAALVVLISALISAFVIPYLRARTTKEQLDEAMFWIRHFVEAAEQIYSSSQGEEKKNYVLNKLTEKGYEIDLDELSDLIESEVLKLHAELYGATR